jgi:hypothetical protein
VEHETPSPDAGLARRLLLVPVIVCSLQAVGLFVNAVGALADPGQGLGSASVEAVVLVLLGLALVVVAVGLLRSKGWARGPLIALQLIALLTALAYAGLDSWLGWVLALTSAASVLVALSRPVADLLEGGATPDLS